MAADAPERLKAVREKLGRSGNLKSGLENERGLQESLQAPPERQWKLAATSSLLPASRGIP